MSSEELLHALVAKLLALRTKKIAVAAEQGVLPSLNPPPLNLPEALRAVGDAARALEYYQRLDPLRALESAQRTIEELNHRLHRSTAEQLRLRFDLDQAEHCARTFQIRCEAVTLELQKLRTAISEHLTDT